MLTLNTAGKSVKDSAKIIKDAISRSNDDEIKILIGEPGSAENIKKILESNGFNDIIPEDNDGELYITASKVQVNHENVNHESAALRQTVNSDSIPSKTPVPSSTGVLISCRNREYNSSFMKKFLSSLVQSNNKPDVIGLLDSAVKIAAYNSPLCTFLKKLEASGVQILISESCSDRLEIGGAAGAGVITDMSEIIDEVFSCGKVISI